MTDNQKLYRRIEYKGKCLWIVVPEAVMKVCERYLKDIRWNLGNFFFFLDLLFMNEILYLDN